MLGGGWFGYLARLKPLRKARPKGNEGVYGAVMGTYDPQYPRPDVNREVESDRQREAEERARKERVANEIHPPWWQRLRQALRPGRSSTPPAS
jgi:hypothetical protein